MNMLNQLLWLTYRLLLINFTIVLAVNLLQFAKVVIFMPNNAYTIPFQLTVVSVFLCNLVYLMGILFEIIYLKLWNHTIHFKQVEIRFFKVALVMLGIISAFAFFSFFIQYFSS